MSAFPAIVPASAIDADWMNHLFRAKGIDSQVANLEMREVGTGQTGECFRFSLAYAQSDAPGPASLVGKFPAQNPDSFRVAMASGDYAREVKFYRDIASGAGIASPLCYLAEIDDASGAFVLLLEDLAPAEQGNQLEGVSLEQARLVVEEAAKFHASHWNDTALLELDWVKQTPRAASQLPSPDSIVLTAEAFCLRFEGRVSDDAKTVCRRYAERVAHYRSLPRKAKCLAHYDFRPDNMMFATSAGGRPVTVVDWQTLSYAAGADDLAYFLAGALPPKQRRAHEPELLARYLDGLGDQIVSEYSMADLERDYAAGGFRLLATAMGGAMAVKQTARGDLMFTQMIEAAVAFIRDHAALDLLE